MVSIAAVIGSVSIVVGGAGSGTGIGGGVRSAASGSGFAAGVPAVAASGVVLVVAVSIAGIAFPVIVRMQVIVQLEDPVPVAVIGHDFKNSIDYDSIFSFNSK